MRFLAGVTRSLSRRTNGETLVSRGLRRGLRRCLHRRLSLHLLVVSLLKQPPPVVGTRVNNEHFNLISLNVADIKGVNNRCFGATAKSNANFHVSALNRIVVSRYAMLLCMQQVLVALAPSVLVTS